MHNPQKARMYSRPPPPLPSPPKKKETPKTKQNKQTKKKKKKKASKQPSKQKETTKKQNSAPPPFQATGLLCSKQKQKQTNHQVGYKTSVYKKSAILRKNISQDLTDLG